jgi:hypothetical protein
MNPVVVTVFVRPLVGEGLSRHEPGAHGQPFVHLLDPCPASFVGLECRPALMDGAEPDGELHPATAESVKGARL